MDFRFDMGALLFSDGFIAAIVIGIACGTTGFFIFEINHNKLTFFRRNYLGVIWSLIVLLLAAAYWQENTAAGIESTVKRWQVLVFMIAGAIAPIEAFTIFKEKILKRFGNGNGKKEKDD